MACIQLTSTVRRLGLGLGSGVFRIFGRGQIKGSGGPKLSVGSRAEAPVENLETKSPSS